MNNDDSNVSALLAGICFGGFIGFGCALVGIWLKSCI